MLDCSGSGDAGVGRKRDQKAMIYRLGYLVIGDAIPTPQREVDGPLLILMPCQRLRTPVGFLGCSNVPSSSGTAQAPATNPRSD